MNSCCSRSEHQGTGSAQPFPDSHCAVSSQSWGTHSALQTPRLQTRRGWPILKQKGFRVETASFSLAAVVPCAAETHADQGCRDMKVLVGIVLWPSTSSHGCAGWGRPGTGSTRGCRVNKKTCLPHSTRRTDLSQKLSAFDLGPVSSAYSQRFVWPR